MGRCVVKGCAQDGPHPVLRSPLRGKNKTLHLSEGSLTVSTHLDSLRPHGLFYGVLALYQSTWAFVLVKSCQKAAQARDRCPLFQNRCGLALCPFFHSLLAGAAVAPCPLNCCVWHLLCLTSANGAQGTSLSQMQSSCMSCKFAAATQLPGSACCCRGCTCVLWGAFVCACHPDCVSSLQKVTPPAVTMESGDTSAEDAMHSRGTWGSTGVTTAESAPRPSHSCACLSYSSLCSKLPVTPHLLSKLEECIGMVSALPK